VEVGVQFDPDGGTPGRDNLHHAGTISADGAGLFDSSWGQFADFGGEITSFGDLYP